MRVLSHKQQLILDFIHRFVEGRGYPPTIRDIVTGCGISSTSVADYNLDILEKDGCIIRDRDVSRGIRLCDGPISVPGKIRVPVIGQIAAGEPIPVPSSDTWDTIASADTLEVTTDLTQGKANIYALKVKGMSMVDALINDGDIVLMQYVNVVENGEMAAVWLKNEKRATLKKVYAGPDRIRLQPANSSMKPIFVEPDNVEIQGKVVTVIRKLS